MKRTGTYLFSLFCLAISYSCKSQEAKTPEYASGTSSTENSIHAIGKITHAYKSSGCGTVIISISKEDTLFLIPMNPLGKFDKNGLQISFDYRILRVHNPKGCKQGTPIQISNIKKKH